MIDPNLLLGLQQALSKHPQVVAGYVLGSFPKGLTRKESDFDLCIVVENKKKVTQEDIYQLFTHISFPKNLDLSVVDKGSSPLFLFQAVSTGERIYQRSEDEVINFESGVLKNYYDTAHMRKIYYSYLKDKFPSHGS